MSARLDELARRRERLIERAAEQRAVLAATGSALAPAGRLADGVLQAKRSLEAHPAWAAAAAAAGGLLLLRRRRMALWLGRAWMVWRAGRRARMWLRNTAAR